MTFDGLNLNPFSKIKSDSGKKGFSNLPMLERKAKARLLANQYSNEQAIEAAKLGYQSQLDAFKPKETSWGDVAMGVFGSASKAGLFDKPSIGTQVGNQLGDFLEPSASSSDGSSLWDFIGRSGK